MTNPLLKADDLPSFSKIKPEHVVPAVDAILADNRRQLLEILKSTQPFTWGNLVYPLQEQEDRLNKAWSPVSHLHSVAENDALRSVYNECLDKLTDYSTEVGQNHDLYLAYKQIAESEQFANLDYAQIKIIDNALRDFKLSGVALNPEEKAEFKKIQQDLSRAQTKFEENVLDATRAWSLVISDKERLSGIPEAIISLAANNAQEKEQDGWMFTLDFPCYLPVMQYASDQSLRKQMYEAYVTRASSKGPGNHEFDNSFSMEQILALRTKKANMLGFENYADYSLARKMAKSPDEVLSFLSGLAQKSYPVAKAEFNELTEFSRDQFQVTTLNAWDVAYFSEKLRKYKFDISQEQLKPYFPVKNVLAGLFFLVNKLYGLNIVEKNKIDGWHSDVRIFEIYDIAGDHRGSFYIDLYARPHKRGGAWMDECRVRKKNGSVLQIPVAYLTCNFTPPIGEEPSLLTHDEVSTLFHEFGHGLHHMLTLIDYPAVSGINGVPWDAVELPSQFMENWCWERPLLDIIGKHFKTGEILPDKLFNKMIQAKNFQSGMQMVRQLEFALFDFQLHYNCNDYRQDVIQKLLDEIRSEISVLIPPEYNRFQHSFTHIFAGGYAAGYYSYKWAEVLSADAYSKFEEKGVFDRETGELFLHTILEQGGACDPMDLFVEFRGREPSIESLLRHAGIEPQPPSVI